MRSPFLSDSFREPRLSIEKSSGWKLACGMRAGGQAGIAVLQENQGEWSPQHVAFTVDETEIDRAAALLREQGVAVDGPYFHEWMPAKSIYFADPDGHDLELCAPVEKK